MALVVSFLPDPAKAASEMARVVRPGGWVATYMWDIPGGGSPIAPLNRAARSLGLSPPSTAERARVSDGSDAGAVAERRTCAGRLMRDPNFDRIFQLRRFLGVRMPGRIGPIGEFINSLSPTGKEQMRARVREQLPTAADGRVTYEAFANAVKGRVPA